MSPVDLGHIKIANIVKFHDWCDQLHYFPVIQILENSVHENTSDYRNKVYRCVIWQVVWEIREYWELL